MSNLGSDNKAQETLSNSTLIVPYGISHGSKVYHLKHLLRLGWPNFSGTTRVSDTFSSNAELGHYREVNSSIRAGVPRIQGEREASADPHSTSLRGRLSHPLRCAQDERACWASSYPTHPTEKSRMDGAGARLLGRYISGSSLKVTRLRGVRLLRFSIPRSHPPRRTRPGAPGPRLFCCVCGPATQRVPRPCPFTKPSNFTVWASFSAACKAVPILRNLWHG
jgi:hypothetical protein